MSTEGREGEDVPDDTLTIQLGGNVPLTQFAEAVRSFTAIVQGLSETLSPLDEIEWTIADLDYGSALATVRGEAKSRQSAPVLEVIRAYNRVGDALAKGERVPYGQKVRRAALSIAKLPDSKITVVRFITADDESEIRQPEKATAPVLLHRSAYAVVEGRVQTLSETRGLRFVLYESRFGTPVTCYLREGHREVMRGIWGSRATVEGWVTRDRDDGRPISVRQVETILPLPEVEPGTFRRARGILARVADEPTPEERIRALRDAE